MAAGNWSTSRGGSCHRGVDTFLFGDCGLGGTCNNGSSSNPATIQSCLCEIGWSGHSDFVPYDLQEWGGPVLMCGIHSTTLRVLWGLTIVPCLMLIHATIRALLEQLKTYHNSRHAQRWYHHFTLVICVIGIPLITISAAGTIGLKLVDKPAAIGVDFWVTFFYSTWTFVTIYLNLGYSLMTLRMTMRTIRSSGGMEAEEAEKSEQSARRWMIGSTIPTLTIDVPLVIASLITPGPTDNGFGAKGAIFVFRAAHIFLAVLCLLWSTRGLKQKTSDMFAQVLAFPMDPHMEQRVKDVRDGMLAGQRAIVAGCLVQFGINTVLIMPVWYILAFTYFQPITRLLITIGSWKQVVGMSQKTTKVSVASVTRIASQIIGRRTSASSGTRGRARTRSGSGEAEGTSIHLPVMPETWDKEQEEAGEAGDDDERTRRILAAMNDD